MMPPQGEANSHQMYRALGVERTATASDIKRAYHRLALRYHVRPPPTPLPPPVVRLASDDSDRGVICLAARYVCAARVLSSSAGRHAAYISHGPP